MTIFVQVNNKKTEINTQSRHMGMLVMSVTCTSHVSICELADTVYSYAFNNSTIHIRDYHPAHFESAAEKVTIVLDMSNHVKSEISSN